MHLVRTLQSFALVSSALICVSALAQPAAPLEQTSKSIKVDGSSAVAPFVRPASAPFGRARKIGINVGDQGSKEGIRCAKTKTCHLGMSTNEIPPEDAAEVVTTLLGYEGAAIVVSTDVTVSSLTTEAIAGIYSGKHKNWKELGGPDIPITAWQRDKNRGVRDLFDKLTKVDSKGLTEIGTNDELINRIKKAKGTITFLGMGRAISEHANGALKLMSLNGVEPSVANVASGKYPLKRNVYLVRHKDFANDETLNALIEELLKARKEYFPKLGFIEH